MGWARDREERFALSKGIAKGSRPLSGETRQLRAVYSATQLRCKHVNSESVFFPWCTCHMYAPVINLICVIHLFICTSTRIFSFGAAAIWIQLLSQHTGRDRYRSFLQINYVPTRMLSCTGSGSRALFRELADIATQADTAVINSICVINSFQLARPNPE